MFPEIIYLGIGFVIGYAIALSNREVKTFEEVDEELRKQHDYYRNLAESLQDDVTYLRRKVSALQVIANEKQK